MDEKIINAIRTKDITELKSHSLAEVGFDSVVCDALRVIGIVSLAELVNIENMQQLIAVVDGFSAENKKSFYSICRKANIRISEEMRNVPRIEQSDEKKTFVNGEMLYKYISSVTEKNSIAWVKAIKGTENAIALSFLKALFGKTPSKEDIKSLRCYYSAVRGQAFNDYCLSEFGNFGIDLQFKHASLLLLHISIAYEASAELETDEFIVYQLYDEKNEINPFRGLFAIKNDESSIQVAIRKNHLFFNNLINKEDTNKLRLTANITRLSSYIVMQKHYLYILEKGNANYRELAKVKEQIALLIELCEKAPSHIFVVNLKEDMLLLRKIEDAVDRHIVATDDIEELDFSIRTHNCLKRAGITTIADLQSKTEEDLIRVRNLGKKSFEEILAVMFAHGFRIKDNPEPPVEYKFGSNVEDYNIRHCILNSQGYFEDFFVRFTPTGSDINDTNEEKSPTILKEDDTIDKIDLSVRAFNCLRRRGIETIKDLTELTYDELIKTRNLGIRNIVEILVTMYDKGFRFKDCLDEQYTTIEAYLLDKVSGGKERILEYFPDGILNIGSLQGRKLDFENVKKPPQNELQLSDEELSKKAEALAARESELEKREAAIAEKEAYIKQLEKEMAEKAHRLQGCVDEFEGQHIEGGETH